MLLLPTNNHSTFDFIPPELLSYFPEITKLLNEEIQDNRLC